MSSNVPPAIIEKIENFGKSLDLLKKKLLKLLFIPIKKSQC